MRAKRPAAVLVLLLAIGLLPATVVLANHHPLVSDVVGVAVQTYNMNCQVSASQWDCNATSLEGPPWVMRAVVKPGSGSVTSLRTDAWVSSTPLDAFFQGWMNDLHQTACVNDRFAAAAVSNFVAGVGSLTSEQNVTPLTITNECNLTGGLDFVPNTAGGPQWDYWINANVIQPPPPPTATPTPTVAPTATPKPTAMPTATPSLTATPKPTATATATATSNPTATASASESASASVSASASESPSASETATPAPADSPEQSVAGATFTPEPSVPPGAPNQGVGGWPGSVPSAGDVSTNAADVGSSALAAGLLLVVMGFIGELFNNTMETNYDRISAWWKKSWVGSIGRGLAGLFGGGAA